MKIIWKTNWLRKNWILKNKKKLMYFYKFKKFDLICKNLKSEKLFMINIIFFFSVQKILVVFYKLFLDTQFESSCNKNKKLVSFPGQTGVHENFEKLLNIRKDLHFRFLLKKKSDLNKLSEIFNKNCNIKKDLKNEANQKEGEWGNKYFFCKYKDLKNEENEQEDRWGNKHFFFCKYKCLFKNKVFFKKFNKLIFFGQTSVYRNFKKLLILISFYIIKFEMLNLKKKTENLFIRLFYYYF